MIRCRCGSARYIMIAARNLDRAFARFCSRVAEEDALCKRQPRKLVGDRFLPLDAIKVRGVPELFGLRLKRRDESRMRMTERVDGDARPEIEIAFAVLSGQPAALTAHEDDVLTGVNAHHSG